MITGHEEARVIHLKVLRPQIEIVLGRIPNILNKVEAYRLRLAHSWFPGRTMYGMAEATGSIMSNR